jgi:RHS repeat-associated protein
MRGLSILTILKQAYGYTAEYQGDYNELIYLRARMYAPNMGRYITTDPSGLEDNPYVYVQNNPVNFSDPSGLFSPDQIASSMGFKSGFESMISIFDTSAPSDQFSRAFRKWGFFTALLDAKSGDTIAPGSLILLTDRPFVLIRREEMIWTRSDCQIMIGARTLSDYFYSVAATATIRELPAQYWRDTSPHYWQLSGRQSYVDGSTTTDIPDFHSIDISSSIGKFGSYTISLTTDLFGNSYINVPDLSIDPITLGRLLGKKINGQLSFPFSATYSEGYICRGGADCIDRIPPQNDTLTRNFITGPCASVGNILAVGKKSITCANGEHGEVYSWGYAAGIGNLSGSIGWYLTSNQNSGWNWAIQDRQNGIDYLKLLRYAHSK